MNPYDRLNKSTKDLNKVTSKKVEKPKKIGKFKKDQNKQNHQSSSIKSHKKEYSTIRIDLNLAEKLKALQSITNDHSRTKLLKRMLRIVYPVILNNKDKVNRFKKVSKSIKNINQTKRKLNL